MTDSSSRADTVSSVEEAVKSGSTVKKACGFAGISRRTYERWVHDIKTMGKSEDKRPLSVHPTPKNKISAQERKMILDVCNSKEFCDRVPPQYCGSAHGCVTTTGTKKPRLAPRPL